jgi:hypothetical protein
MRDTKALARHYDHLTPQERFRLILAAGSRGDAVERDRLVNSGGHIALSMRDHAPYAHAFDELAFLVFIELLEEAARYLETFAHADDAGDSTVNWPTRIRNLSRLCSEPRMNTLKQIGSVAAPRSRKHWVVALFTSISCVRPTWPGRLGNLIA